MAINETAKPEERNPKLFLRDNLPEIMAIIAEEKKRNLQLTFDYDTGVAMQAFLHAAKNGRVPDGPANDPAITEILNDLFHEWDWTEFKALYDAQTEKEHQDDIDDFNNAVREYYKTLEGDKAE